MSEAGPDSLPGEETPEDVQKREREEAVSAAVRVVVASARHGVVTLCASVAHVIRDKMRLEQKISELERKVSVLESNNTSSDSGVICHSGSQADSLPESPSSLRCGSAPPSFLNSPARKLSGNDRHIVQEVCQNCESGGNQFYCTACRERQVNQRNSASSPWAKKDEVGCGFLRSKSTDTNANRKEGVCGFSRGHAHASTRSLNLHRVPSVSRFMRRKYSTISLRKVQRAGLSSKGSSSGTLSQQSSSNSSGSQEWGEDGSRRGSSGSRSYVVTVAEVYTPPSSHSSHTTSESAAVKLLARKLASVMQEDEFEEDQPSHLDCSDGIQPPLSPLSTMPAKEDLCAPHPLSRCECVVCMRLLSDPSCAVYALTTSEGSLLPRGSTVLIRGDMIGTVLYFGHRRHPIPSQAIWYQPPSDSRPTQAPTSACSRNKGDMGEAGGSGTEVTTHPVGVTVTLWPPDQGEMFVPLSDVVCQLDEEEEIESQDYPCSITMEECPAHILQSESVHADHESQRESFNNAELSNSDPLHAQSEHSFAVHVESCNAEPQNAHHPLVSNDRESPKYSLYNTGDSKDHEPCVEALNPSVNQRLGFVSNCNEENLKNSNKSIEENFVPELCDEKACSLYLRHADNSVDTVLSRQEIVDNSFAGRYSFSSADIQKNLDDPEPEVSLYDTSDSAISLSSSRRPHIYYKTECERDTHQLSNPSSLTELDRDSPHFGDTWDSGCCMRRERYGSLSSEQLSDVECEGSQQRSSWAKSLHDAFDIMWDKYHGNQHSSFTYDSARPCTDYEGSDPKSARDYLVTNSASDLEHVCRTSNPVSDYPLNFCKSVTGTLCSNPKSEIICPPVNCNSTIGYPFRKKKAVDDHTSDNTTHTIDAAILGLKNYSNPCHSLRGRQSSVQRYFLNNCSVDDSEV